ncbi:hypothetical protein B0H16DRAFT_342810, partial [Mycena metata]
MGRQRGIARVESGKPPSMRSLYPGYESQMLQDRSRLGWLSHLQGLQTELRSPRALCLYVYQGRIFQQIRGFHGGVQLPPTEGNTGYQQVKKSRQKKNRRSTDHRSSCLFHRTISRHRSDNMLFVHKKFIYRIQKRPAARTQIPAAGAHGLHPQQRGFSRVAASIRLCQRSNPSFAVGGKSDDRRSRRRQISACSLRSAPSLHRILRVGPGGSRDAVMIARRATVTFNKMNIIRDPYHLSYKRSPRSLAEHPSNSMYYMQTKFIPSPLT